MLDRGIARDGYKVLDLAGREIGYITEEDLTTEDTEKHRGTRKSQEVAARSQEPEARS